MSDSDDNKPAPPRKVQPKPRRRVVSRNRSDNSIGSPTGSSSQDNDSTTAQPHARRRIEDDFFSKAKNFRDITKAQETIYMKESEPEIQESQFPELEPIVMTDVIPIFDFEDEAIAQNAAKKNSREKETPPETKRKRELSVTPPPDMPMRRPMPATIYPVAPSRQLPQTYDILDEDDDVQELDPDLVSIAAKVTTESQLSLSSQDLASASQSSSGTPSQQLTTAMSALDSTPTLSPNTARATPPSSLVSPSIPTNKQEGSGSSISSPTIASPSTANPEDNREINILLRTQRHPHMYVPQELIPYFTELERDLKVTLKANQSFKHMMEFYCQMKRTEISKLVFTFKGSRVLPRSTPNNVDCPRFTVIDVYTLDGYKYMKELEAAQLEKQAEDTRLAHEAKMKAEEAEAAAAEKARKRAERGDEEEEEDEQAEYVMFKIRGKDTADQKIRAKKTTTVGSIISHYKRLRELGADAVVKLEFDDEAMDPAMMLGDTEIEDDDMLIARIG